MQSRLLFRFTWFSGRGPLLHVTLPRIVPLRLLLCLGFVLAEPCLAFTPTGSLAQGRHGHAATLMPSGKVLVTGGDTFTSYLTSAEIYDPTSRIWTTTGSLHNSRTHHTATLLPDGKVM